MRVFADGFSSASLSGGVLRLKLVEMTGENQESTEVGELLIPVVRAEAFARGMTATLQRISDQIKEQGTNNEQTSV